MSKSYENSNISNSQRIAAALLGIAVLVALLFSAFFMTAETDHRCTGEDCPICACIHQCSQNIRQIGDGTVGQIHFVVTVSFLLLPLLCNITNLFYATPVTQKVRLNN